MLYLLFVMNRRKGGERNEEEWGETFKQAADQCALQQQQRRGGKSYFSLLVSAFVVSPLYRPSPCPDASPIAGQSIVGVTFDFHVSFLVLRHADYIDGFE